MTRHEWEPTIRRHRRVTDALARATAAVVDVGRQRPIQPEASFTLAGRDRSCVLDNCERDAAEGSDFCGPCRHEILGGRA